MHTLRPVLAITLIQLRLGLLDQRMSFQRELALLLFSALGYFFLRLARVTTCFLSSAPACFCGSLPPFVLRGVKEAAGINTIVTLAKLVAAAGALCAEYRAPG